MPRDRLYDDGDLAAFYDFDNPWIDGFDAVLDLARTARSVLDLGCGTGKLAALLAAQGRRVVGVDPARPMLDIARSREGGRTVEWIEADARDVRLGAPFDLVVLTGHAFQVFLTEADRAAALATIAAHLTEGGRFVFDTRNPLAREWEEWTPASSRRSFDHPRHGRVDAWNTARLEPATGIVTYETHYRTEDGGSFAASSRIAFPGRREVEEAIGQASLSAREWRGAWQGAPWHPGSPEIIPFGGLARRPRL